MLEDGQPMYVDAGCSETYVNKYTVFVQHAVQALVYDSLLCLLFAFFEVI